jgi:alkaline phosphatase D
MGLYSTYSFGRGDKTVRFILLDLKYNQSSYLNNDKYDMLGDRQWDWLENIFKNKKETYTFICLSNQILSNDRFIIKKWYSDSRKKLFNLIGKYKRDGVIFLSGGIGFAQILKTFCPLPNIGYNLYECTSSGLSYSNKFYSFVDNIYHNDYLIEGTNYNGINFGQVKINWGEKKINDSFIELQIYNQNDSLVSNVKINHNDLIFNNDTKDFYLDENNMKNIRYMNVYDGKSCEREIYHRVRTPFMNLKYYLTNLKQLPIAIITTVLIILIPELLYHKRFIRSIYSTRASIHIKM